MLKKAEINTKVAKKVSEKSDQAQKGRTFAELSSTKMKSPQKGDFTWKIQISF